MNNEIIIGVGGLILSALTYFAGVKRTTMQFKENQKKERMDNVFNRYMEFRKTNSTGGYDGLLKAGVATLENDTDIREICKRIEQHGEKHPLGSNKNILDDVDLKKLFDHIIDNKIDLFRTPVENIIDKIKNESLTIKSSGCGKPHR